VGSTRASHQLTIYTNNKDKAAQVMSVKQDKSSVLKTKNKEVHVLHARAYDGIQK
jgi:hypothetical protein